MPTEDNDRKRRLIRSEEETQGKYNPTPVEPPSHPTEKFYRPRLDEDNMPLPRRVEETDLEGTRVTRAAYEPVTTNNRPAYVPSTQRPPVKEKPGFNLDFIRNINWRSNTGCLLRVLIFSAFAMLILGLCS